LRAVQQAFNVAKYTESVAARQKAETISSVLYPEDSTTEGKILRLKQQFFFTSASLQVERYT
jgi:starch phosphorylase